MVAVIRLKSMTFVIIFDPPPEGDIIVPKSLDDLGGPSVAGRAEICAERNGKGVCYIQKLESDIDWIEDFDHALFQIEQDGTRKVFRKCTDEDYVLFRVPIWIQSPETPVCCDRPMLFVGQIDDNRISSERPEDAKLWWHDAASFYVFTCPVCLECSSIGQQF